MNGDGKEIIVVPSASADIPAPGERGFFNKDIAAPVRLKTDLLRENLAGFVAAINETLKGVPQIVEGFKLDEIDLVIEVTGEGSVQLVGGVKVGASGGITIKLKR